MSSEAITQNDLREILSRVAGSIPSEYKKLLWANPNTASAFTAQTISIDLSDYDEVEVWFNCWRNRPNTSLQFRVKKGTYGIATQGASTNTSSGINPFVVGSYIIVQDRPIYVTDTGVQFGTCTEGASNGTMYNADGSMIPAYIYGIKYERVQPPVLDAEIEVLATGATLYRIGRIRILSLVDFLYGTSITIGVGDRPTTKAVGFGTRHNGSAYITMLRMEVTTSGSVGVFLVGYYNTTTGYTGVASGDVYNAIAIWYVAE